MANTAAPPQPEKAPWWDAYPEVETKNLKSISREELLELIKNGKQNDFILVDTRQKDHDGGSIHHSINIPVQTLHPAIPTWYSIFKATGRKTIIWYCNSCGGRGLRATGWFQDHIDSKGDTELKSIYLDGGIKGWVQAGEAYTAELDEFDAGHWKAVGVL